MAFSAKGSNNICNGEELNVWWDLSKVVQPMDICKNIYKIFGLILNKICSRDPNKFVRGIQWNIVYVPNFSCFSVFLIFSYCPFPIIFSVWSTTLCKRTPWKVSNITKCFLGSIYNTLIIKLFGSITHRNTNSTDLTIWTTMLRINYKMDHALQLRKLSIRNHWNYQLKISREVVPKFKELNYLSPRIIL